MLLGLIIISRWILGPVTDTPRNHRMRAARRGWCARQGVLVAESLHCAQPVRQRVDDVVNTITWEQLTDVVLVGHSYGGMVITGVADRIPERIRRLVYVEAFVPESGESVERLTGEGFRSLVSENTRDGQIHASWSPAARPVPKDAPHPLRTFTDTLVLTNPAASRLPASYILTTEKGADASADGFAPFAARAAARGWPVHHMEVTIRPHGQRPRLWCG